jgi:hypothetical protein
MMDLLQNLLSGNQRQEYEDFVQRYDRGSPYDGISDEEAIQRYHQVAPQLPPNVYEDAARDAFAKLSPQQRAQLGRYLQQQTRQQGMDFPDLNRDGIDDRLQDPSFLAQVTGRMHQQQPGLLEQLLGSQLGGGAGGLGGLAGGLLGGQQAQRGTPQQRGGQQGSLLDNPLAKAALAGIAAMAVRRMMGGAQQGGTPQAGGPRNPQGGNNPFGGTRM